MKYKVSILVIVSVLLCYISEAQVSILVGTKPSRNIKFRHVKQHTEKGLSIIDPDQKLQSLGVAGNGDIILKDAGGNVLTLPENQLTEEKTKLSISGVGGALTFPFKWRPQNGSIEPSLSLSGVGGIHIPTQDSNFSVNLLAGVGVSSISLNKNNSTYADTGSTTRAAGTFSFTILAQLNNVQFGATIGVDNNVDNTTDKWKFQSKPWFAIGIGVSIFNSN